MLKRRWLIWSQHTACMMMDLLWAHRHILSDNGIIDHLLVVSQDNRIGTESRIWTSQLHAVVSLLYLVNHIFFPSFLLLILTFLFLSALRVFPPSSSAYYNSFDFKLCIQIGKPVRDCESVYLCSLTASSVMATLCVLASGEHAASSSSEPGVTNFLQSVETSVRVP